MDFEQVKNVVHAFLTLFPTRSREKNNHNLFHFYGTLQLGKSYEHTMFPLPWQNLLWTKQGNCILFIHLHMYILYRGKSPGKARSPKGSMSVTFGKHCLPRLDTEPEHSQVRKVPQDSASWFKCHTLFSSAPSPIFASYADCSSLESLQYHLVASKEFPELKPHWAYDFK